MSTNFPFGSNDLQGKLPFADQVRKPADICRRKSKGNPQSEQANERVHSTKKEMQNKIWKFINRHNRYGATCEEVKDGMRIPYTTASARISELKSQGRIHKSGKTRPTSTGSPATVYLTDWWWGKQTVTV